MLARIRSIQSQIPSGIAWFISNQSHIEYLTDFVSLLPTEREGFLWLTKTHACLIHASFSPAPNRDDISYFQGCYSSQLSQHLKSLLAKEPISSIVIDGSTLWHDEFLTLQTVLEHYPTTVIKKNQQEISGSGSGDSEQKQDLIMNARSIKDGIEIAAMREAGQIIGKVVEEVRVELRAGMTEQYVCQLIETKLRTHGSSQPAFPTIVAFGNNTSLPHHQPTATILEENMAILIDCGATHNRYRSDMTRSWWFGDSPDPEYLKIESVVLAAYKAGIDALKSKFDVRELTLNESERHKIELEQSEQIEEFQDAFPDEISDEISMDECTAAQLDTACRMVIHQAGYASRFIHTTGHGVGLDIHESPSISGSNKHQLKAGMVITIEPGIYLPGSHGYRHENTVLLG